MKKLDVLAATLVLVGGLNWGLVAVARFDLVAWICGGMEFGETNAASRVIPSTGPNVGGDTSSASTTGRKRGGSPKRRARNSSSPCTCR